MNGPKVGNAALVTSDYMLGTPVYPLVLAADAAVTIHGVRTISRKEFREIMAYDPSKVPPKIGYYLAGFADGEGSFDISFRKRKDYSQPWKISLCFNVSQRDKVILALFKKHLQCGTLRRREDGVWYYEVSNFTAIVNNVIPFFRNFGFLSAKKKRDFSKFQRLAKLMEGGEHLNEEGIRKILAIRGQMNDGGAGRRKYSDSEILRYLESGQSSETTRQTLAENK